MLVSLSVCSKVQIVCIWSSWFYYIPKPHPRNKQYQPISWSSTAQQQRQQPFNGRLSKTTRVGRYQKKHSPAHTPPGQRTSFITFLHFQRSTASSLFSLRAWQSSRTTSFQVLFGLPLVLEPSTSYSIHFFQDQTQSWRTVAQDCIYVDIIFVLRPCLFYCPCLTT